MTKKHSRNSESYTVVTGRGSKNKDWSKHAETRHQQLNADIEAFLASGGEISEQESPSLDQEYTYKVTHPELHAMTLFDGDKVSATAPETVSRTWNPVSVAINVHDGA